MARLAGVPRAGRTSAFAAIAEESRLHINYVRRVFAAYTFVIREAPIYGVRLDEIEAPVSSIEALGRISRLSPEDAGLQTRPALLGLVSYSFLLSVSATLESMAKDEAELKGLDLDLRSVSALISKELGVEYMIVDERSQTAIALRAEIEFVGPTSDQPSGAVAIASPRWQPPASRPKAEDTRIAVLAASLDFAGVFYIAVDIEDWRSLLKSLERSSVDLSRIKPIFPNDAATQPTPGGRPRRLLGADRRKTNVQA